MTEAIPIKNQIAAGEPDLALVDTHTPLGILSQFEGEL